MVTCHESSEEESVTYLLLGLGEDSGEAAY